MNFDSYLILEDEVPFEQRVDQQSYTRKRVAFSYDNLHILEQTFGEAYQWLVNTENRVFLVQDGNDIINSSLKPVPHIGCESIHLKGMSEVVLTLTPTIKQNQFGNTQRAVLICFGANPPKQICSLDLNQTASVLYFLQHFDLCSTSLMVAELTISSLPFLNK
jgi:hypothetical protein